MTIATERSISSRSMTSPIAAAMARVSIVPLTIDQYSRLIEERIIPEDATVELLRGAIVWKDRASPNEDPIGHGKEHQLVISLLTVLAARINGSEHFVRIQLPIACPPNGAPEPDAAIVRGTPRDYAGGSPQANDVSCVIEVAHSSLERDREDKLPIYASVAIPQYVIINLFDKSIEIYTDPDSAAEQYRTKVTVTASQSLSFRLPDGWFELTAREVLP